MGLRLILGMFFRSSWIFSLIFSLRELADEKVIVVMYGVEHVDVWVWQ